LAKNLASFLKLLRVTSTGGSASFAVITVFTVQIFHDVEHNGLHFPGVFGGDFFFRQGQGDGFNDFFGCVAKGCGRPRRPSSLWPLNICGT